MSARASKPHLDGLTLAGVGDQRQTCPNGSRECLRLDQPPCSDCFFDGDDQ